MALRLQKAYITDCTKIHKMQVTAFKQLLDKYGDIDTNPGAEPVEKIILRMNQDVTDYYLIQFNDEIIGAIRIVGLQGNIFRISPMFILPEFQGKGFAQQTISAVEKLYLQTTGWQLDTIKEETKLCHLYEKMGYQQTGEEERLKDGMTIVYYAKEVSVTS